MNRPEPHPEDRNWTFYEKDPGTTFYRGRVPDGGIHCTLAVIHHHDRTDDDPEAVWWTADRTTRDGRGCLSASGWTSGPADARRQAETAYRRLEALIGSAAAATVESRNETADGGTVEKLRHEGETIYRVSGPDRSGHQPANPAASRERNIRNGAFTSSTTSETAAKNARIPAGKPPAGTAPADASKERIDAKECREEPRPVYETARNRSRRRD